MQLELTPKRSYLKLTPTIYIWQLVIPRNGPNTTKFQQSFIIWKTHLQMHVLFSPLWKEVCFRPTPSRITWISMVVHCFRNPVTDVPFPFICSIVTGIRHGHSWRKKSREVRFDVFVRTELGVLGHCFRRYRCQDHLPDFALHFVPQIRTWVALQLVVCFLATLLSVGRGPPGAFCFFSFGALRVFCVKFLATISLLVLRSCRFPEFARAIRFRSQLSEVVLVCSCLGFSSSSCFCVRKFLGSANKALSV